MITPKMRRRLDILLADDGSCHARAALELLSDLPISRYAMPRSSITILGVLETRERYNLLVRKVGLDEAERLLEHKGVAFECQLVLGHPAQKVIEYANQLCPDLIALGAQGLRATLDILLGGVAQQVVEYANWPVLVVRYPYHGLRRILIVTDGSEYSDCAVKYASMFPFPTKAKVEVLCVLPPFVGSMASAFEMTPGAGKHLIQSKPFSKEAEYWQVQEEYDAQTLLKRAVETFEAEHIKATSISLRGDAASEIIQYAQESQVDLIVAGGRGLSKNKNWLLGSVSRKLVHYANCSVLIVKGSPNLIRSA